MYRLQCSSALATLLALLALADVAASVTAARAPVPGVAAASIVGSVWRDGRTAVPAARVRLRNYSTGRLVDATVANDLGRFAFRDLEGGRYVLEVVNESGKVLAIGQPLAVAPGETVATFVDLRTGERWFAGFFQNAAAAIVSTASSVGVTAIAAGDAACPQ